MADLTHCSNLFACPLSVIADLIRNRLIISATVLLFQNKIILLPIADQVSNDGYSGFPQLAGSSPQ